MHDYAPGLEQAFELDFQEATYPIHNIEGRVPSIVRGRYYVNGPAGFCNGPFRYRHWLDGDGMVCALRFDAGQVRFTNAFVRSTKFRVESEVRRPVFRAFGTAFPGDRLKRGIATESPINVSVYPYAGTLLAFGEQSLPWELDPETLQTRGPFDFGGALNEISPFAAHPKIIPATGELFNFGVSFSAAEPRLTLYRFAGPTELVYRERMPLPYPATIHDFTLSRNYVVFYLSPYLLDLAGLLHAGRTTMESLRWEPQRGSFLLLADRATGQAVATIPIGNGYCLHLINSFEQDGRLVVDVIEFERPIYDQYQILPHLFTDVPEGGPVRLIVDIEAHRMVERVALDYRLAPDFPSIDPRHETGPYKDFWMLGIAATGKPGRKFFDQLVHANWQRGVKDVYRAPPGHYLGGEPVFIPNPVDAHAGLILCQVFEAARNRSAFALFDAFSVANGPLALLRLESPVPLGFHASFKVERAER